MHGVLLIDKPQGPTSHDVVNEVRRRFGVRRVGHAGSLDPLATGALVVAVGPATRFLQYLPIEPKEYVAGARFGVETTTQDRLGDPVAELPVPADLEDQIAAALPGLVGEVLQVPPAFSAVKRAGRPLYKYAREGKPVEVEARKVVVEAFEMLSLDPPAGEFRIVCSGGTYARTLVHDLGAAISCGAHLTSLRRTRVGRFGLEMAVGLDQVAPSDLVPLRKALEPMPVVELAAADVLCIREGRPVQARSPVTGRLAALADPDGRVFSVARIDGPLLRPECVIPEEALVGTA